MMLIMMMIMNKEDKFANNEFIGADDENIIDDDEIHDGINNHGGCY